MPITTEQIHAGQAVYTPKMLAIYDVLVLGLSNRWIGMPTPRLLAHYDQHISGNHLDVGVGTGYFLDRCRFPTPTPRIALMDLNRDALQFSARRIARYEPETYVRNVLETIDFDGAKFELARRQLSPALSAGRHGDKGARVRFSVAVDVSRRRRLRLDAAAGWRGAQLRRAEADGVL